MLLAFAGSIQLVPDGTLIFHLILIIAMVALLNATLLKPINQILEERDRRTKGRMSEAQAAVLTVEQKLREYEGRLREARAEGYALMESERAALSSERERRVGDVRAEMGRSLSEQKDKLRLEVEVVKGALKGEAQRLAFEISRQILQRDLTGRPHSNL